MLKKIAWNTFKKTGNIDSFMEFKKIEEMKNEISDLGVNKIQKVEQDGEFENKWNNNWRT